MTDTEFLAACLTWPGGTDGRIRLWRADYLRLLRLARLEETEIYRSAARDGQDAQEIWASSMRWLAREAGGGPGVRLRGKT